uniref:Uncharacterized protein n=1 Tax=Xenopus tropicalis TaxID=8364 RepID=A0A1B8Y7X5_XENTR
MLGELKLEVIGDGGFMLKSDLFLCPFSCNSFSGMQRSWRTPVSFPSCKKGSVLEPIEVPKAGARSKHVRTRQPSNHAPSSCHFS